MDDGLQRIIEQVTQHKLQYVKQLLQSANLPHTGTRARIRERLADAVEKKRITVLALAELLGELDIWGNQRVRLSRLPLHLLVEYETEEAIIQKAVQCGLEKLLCGEIALVPSEELAPMTVAYEESAGWRRLKLIAAKTRRIHTPQSEIPERFDEEKYPGVVFLPFKRETQKAIAFAEIDLDTGQSIFSTTLMKQGIRYHAEFSEFFSLFEPLIDLRQAQPIPLFRANRAIWQLSHDETRLVSRRARTSTGGRIEGRSHSVTADMRTDVELEGYFPSGSDATGLHCNCFWEPADALEERVHTHVYAPQGEISIIGQVKEASVRHVLHRILSLN